MNQKYTRTWCDDTWNLVGRKRQRNAPLSINTWLMTFANMFARCT